LNGATGANIVLSSSAFSIAPGSTYIPTYYPGTADMRSATALELNAGANLGGVNFTLTPLPTLHVRGTVPGGGASVTLASLDPAANIVMRPVNADAVNGSFDFRGVAPGPYLVIAHSTELKGSVRIDVRDANVDNLVIAIGSPIIIPTHVSFDDRISVENDPDFEFVRINLIPDPSIAGISGDTYGPFPNGSMGFEVMTGEGYRIKLSTMFDTTGRFHNAYIKSIRMGTHDVLNEGLQYSGEPDAKVEIVIGLKPGTLSGSVVTTVNSRQQPVVNTTAVLVPDMARRRRSDLYRIATTDSNGRFQMDVIPPGDYTVFSWDDVESGAWQDPDFIRLYEDRGTRIHIAEGSKATITVPLILPR
jgi:hypothetical protein